MRDKLTKVKDIARDVEQGNKNVKALTFCIRALAEEIKELKEKANEKQRP